MGPRKFRSAVSVFWAAFAIAIAIPAWAIDPPLRNASGLAKPVNEVMLRVTTAKVILADYDLLKKDFPELRAMTHDEIDRWLVSHTGFISRAQAAQKNVNTKISVAAEESTVLRPKDYDRAAVFKIGDFGFIDAKGVGSVRPTQMDHRNGLATLGEGIREFSYEKLVHRIFRHSQSGYDTVGTYAVIDYGFDIIHADGTRSPAGEILRQAHERYEGHYSLFDEKKSVEIERVLRRYGITSAGAYHDAPFEKINIQGTKDGAVLDFGGFLSLDRFEKRATHFYGSKILLDPKSPGFIQPDPNIRVPFDRWGYTVSGKVDPKLDNPWLWSHELADSLRKGTATREDVDQHLRNLLEPVEARLSAHPLRSLTSPAAPIGECVRGMLRPIVNAR